MDNTFIKVSTLYLYFLKFLFLYFCHLKKMRLWEKLVNLFWFKNSEFALLSIQAKTGDFGNSKADTHVPFLIINNFDCHGRHVCFFCIVGIAKKISGFLFPHGCTFSKVFSAATNHLFSVYVSTQMVM